MKPLKKPRLLFRFPQWYDFLQRYWLPEFYPILSEAVRKSKIKQFDPFSLCPKTIMFWFLIPPYRAIGISIEGLQEISIYGRQQIEPNELIYVLFRILHFKTPIPLTLLTLFTSLGYAMIGAGNKLIQALRSKYETIVPSDESVTPSLDLFSMYPRLSIYYPVINGSLSLGFLAIDEQHAMVSVKQSLEPNKNIFSIVRFLDFYGPYTIMNLIVMLSIALFFCGIIAKYNQKLRQDIINEIINDITLCGGGT